MPTTKPRVQVTLEPSTHAVIDRLAALQGCSRGAVISELIDAVAPALGRTVALLEAAAEAPNQVKAGLLSVVQGVHSELVAVSGDSIAQMDWLLGEFQGASGEGPTPVPVTRGSGMDLHGRQSPHGKRSTPSATRPVADSKPPLGNTAKSSTPKGRKTGGKDAQPSL